jgi:hypothetical protein
MESYDLKKIHWEGGITIWKIQCKEEMCLNSDESFAVASFHDLLAFDLVFDYCMDVLGKF